MGLIFAFRNAFSLGIESFVGALSHDLLKIVGKTTGEIWSIGFAESRFGKQILNFNDSALIKQKAWVKVWPASGWKRPKKQRYIAFKNL